MPLFAVTGSTDLTGLGKGKRVVSWHFSNTGAAAVINLRDGSVSATRYIQIQLPATTGYAALAYGQQSAPLFPNGVYVEVVSGTIIGSVDLV